jgi:hypothetical protein
MNVRKLMMALAAAAGLSLPVALPAQQVANRADWNFEWPAQKATFYNLDFDLKVEGLQKSLYVHTYLALQSANIYFGVQTDAHGDPTTALFTIWLKKDDYVNKRYAMAGAECRPDARKEESADGYVSCFLRNFAGKKGTWYRMRVWATNEVEAEDKKTKVKEWGAWIIELDGQGKTVKETLIGKIGAPTGWITSALYSSFEGFGNYGEGMERCNTLATEWHGKVSLRFPTYNKGQVTSGAPTNAMVADAFCNIRAKVEGGAVVADYGPVTKPTALDVTRAKWNAYSKDGKSLLQPGQAGSISRNADNQSYTFNNGVNTVDTKGTITGNQVKALTLTGEILPAARMIRWAGGIYWVMQ